MWLFNDFVLGYVEPWHFERGIDIETEGFYKYDYQSTLRQGIGYKKVLRELEEFMKKVRDDVGHRTNSA